MTSAPSAIASRALASSAGGRDETIVFLVLLAALVVLPLTGLVYPYFLMQALCFALFACAFNLLIGYVGLLSFGHAMFLGLGGYVGAHAAKVWGLTPELALLCGLLSAAVLGVAVGLLAIRRQGIYFAMTTLALAQMVYFLCLQVPFTHGEDGIQGVPQGRLFGLIDLGKPMALYFTVLAVFVLAFGLIHRIVNSPFGDILKAIRENEPRAISLGYKTERYKLTAFVLSASLAGLAGALKAIVYEVHNTYDEGHAYVFPVSGEDSALARQECAKDFYVSPFLSKDCRYHFRIAPPGEKVAVAIQESEGGDAILNASFSGTRRALTDGALLRLFLRYPLMTLKVVAAIHFEAVRLMLKGVRRHAHAPLAEAATWKRGN